MATALSTPAVSPHGGYWSLSRSPLASLIFVAPLLVGYEAGVIMLGPQAARNGADVWLRWLLDAIGFGQYFLLPVLTVLVLLGWHYTTRQSWRIPGWVYWGMLVESLLLAVCLRLILLLQGMLLEVSPAEPAGLVQHLVQFLRTRIGYLGAGIYEELLFRLILLSLALWLFRRPKLPRWAQMLLAVVLTSLLFSAAHYVGGREQVLWFGIAVGAHAGYDILVGLV